MSNLNIAIVGTDTAAGKLLLEKLEESSMEIEVLYPLEKLPEDYSSIRFRKKTCLIEKLDDFDFTSVSLVFFTGSLWIEARIVTSTAAHREGERAAERQSRMVERGRRQRVRLHRPQLFPAQVQGTDRPYASGVAGKHKNKIT